jgi:hypothetical protein
MYEQRPESVRRPMLLAIGNRVEAATDFKSSKGSATRNLLRRNLRGQVSFNLPERLTINTDLRKKLAGEAIQSDLPQYEAVSTQVVRVHHEGVWKGILKAHDWESVASTVARFFSALGVVQACHYYILAQAEELLRRYETVGRL